MKAAELFVRCLENEGVEAIFGIPGEENIEILDVLLDSKIRFISTRHEQGRGLHGRRLRPPDRPGGRLSGDLGPGATNLVTGVADANMDHAPVVAIAGQSATTRMHKESHQHLDLVNLFRPISKYCTQVIEPETIPEVVRKAFKQAQAEKPGVSFIDFPENIAEDGSRRQVPLKVQHRAAGGPAEKIRQAAEIISPAKYPLILAGNGVIRAGPPSIGPLRREAEHSGGQHVHGQGRDAVFASALAGRWACRPATWSCGFDRADVIICVGYDMVEYHANRWHPGKDRQIIHIDSVPAEVDEHYMPSVEVVGDIGAAWRRSPTACRRRSISRQPLAGHHGRAVGRRRRRRSR